MPQREWAWLIRALVLQSRPVYHCPGMKVTISSPAICRGRRQTLASIRNIHRLVKALAAIPLLPMHLKAPDPKGIAYFKDEAYSDGRDFIFGNGGEAEADRIIFRARMAAATLSLLLGLLVFLAAREMFGDGAALFALALVVFEPNMIAHGAYVTTDMGISCFMFASIYALYRYVKAPSVRRLTVLGLATGLALASKHSGVLLLPFGLALIVTEILWPSPETRTNKRKVALRLTGAFLAASTIAIVVLWAFYGFRYAATARWNAAESLAR
jgi:hypothetical protein